MVVRHSLLFLFTTTLLFCVGCTTTRTTDTARTGLEQLLISNAVDQTLAKTSLPDVNGRKVFLDDKYLDGVDKGYVVGSMRQKLLASGARLVDKKEDSDWTIELCSGGIGTDNVSSYLGVPGLTVPGLPVEIPEIRVYEKNTQFGTAKLGIAAYDSATGALVHGTGTVLSRADDSRWNIMGVGPFQSGTVRNELITNTGDVDLTARISNAVDSTFRR